MKGSGILAVIGMLVLVCGLCLFIGVLAQIIPKMALLMLCGGVMILVGAWILLFTGVIRGGWGA